jgi:stage II sporulation protein AA (anti-sigma F factor antagonist)
MESKFYEEDKLLVFKITDEIDDCSVQKIRRKADYEIERYMPRKVIFDFNSVTFMDSAGIGLIIGRYRKANMLGGTVEIANVTDSIKKVLELSGLLKIIKITELEEMAV